eukprot:359958-Chlamydomonas_euryale.AAC.2
MVLVMRGACVVGGCGPAACDGVGDEGRVLLVAVDPLAVMVLVGGVRVGVVGGCGRGGGTWRACVDGVDGGRLKKI